MSIWPTKHQNHVTTLCHTSVKLIISQQAGKSTTSYLCHLFKFKHSLFVTPLVTSNDATEASVEIRSSGKWKFSVLWNFFHAQINKTIKLPSPLQQLKQFLMSSYVQQALKIYFQNKNVELITVDKLAHNIQSSSFCK